MPTLRVLLRMLLILAFCADGILGAQATTRMAVKHIPPPGSGPVGQHPVHAPRSAERVQESNNCNRIVAGARKAAPDGQGGHDCDCNPASCECSCVLTFYTGRVPAIFAAQHALTTIYLPPPALPPLQRQVSRLFRPPIG